MSRNVTMQQTSSGHGWAWFWMCLAGLYSISPIDMVPDFIPLAGWSDDVLTLLTAGLNLIQSYIDDSNSALASIVKMLKYIILIGGAIIVLILAIIAILVYNIFA